mgnify:CR=1 FL=1
MFCALLAVAVPVTVTETEALKEKLESGVIAVILTVFPLEAVDGTSVVNNRYPVAPDLI